MSKPRNIKKAYAVWQDDARLLGIPIHPYEEWENKLLILCVFLKDKQRGLRLLAAIGIKHEVNRVCLAVMDVYYTIKNNPMQ